MEDGNKVLFDILIQRLELLRELDKEGDSDRRRHVARETSELHAKPFYFFVQWAGSIRYG